MAELIFVNLPITDLDRSIAFYEAIGCRKDARFSNDVAAAMVWSDTISFMLLTPDFFRTFTPKPIADSHATCGVLLCLSRDSRDAVDQIFDAALAAGGREARPTQDMGVMYSRAFEDPDGHTFEPMWMDPAMAEAGAH